ncbi:DUF3095 domain-containing protein [Pseudophaeobacter arcticus]|jgi:hypothetical protein|uniref:DUF3095 domain-containing protein n=1 Tax=Pseudophaeobacter arcticus TaxID=385492 RepID=UPI002492BF6C|nr:DUF3095 domain-containing protein [Pseudophaeobacter arcticus]
MMHIAKFYESLPRQSHFASLTKPAAFTPLPDDWVICCSDIVDSTGLIAAGKYKTVNMVGASVIAAMQNALGGAAFPYVFGGDGTSFAVSAEQAATARLTLAQLRRWVQQEFDITLRVAVIALTEVRSQGLDVTVARHAVSANADYAMFSGGGLAWAEGQMKQGHSTIPADTGDTPPDLTGLSCRWNTIPARNGLILSLVMVPGPTATPAQFSQVAAEILTRTAALARGGHPVPAEGPGIALLPQGLDVEAQLTHGTGSVLLKRLTLMAGAMLTSWLFRRKKPMGQFDPNHYLAVMSANADYRKFDDGLKMTIDCTPDLHNEIKAILQQAQTAGHVRFGLHAQDEARLTCIVPSASRDDHVHFVDGAAGGYTRAAINMGKIRSN